MSWNPQNVKTFPAACCIYLILVMDSCHWKIKSWGIHLQSYNMPEPWQRKKICYAKYSDVQLDFVLLLKDIYIWYIYQTRCSGGNSKTALLFTKVKICLQDPQTCYLFCFFVFFASSEFAFGENKNPAKASLLLNLQ